MSVVANVTEIAAKVANLAKSRGADAAEVLVRDGAELSVQVRLGNPEFVQEAGSRALGLRVFRDKREAVTYTSDMRDISLERFVDETVELAKLSEPDEFHTLPEKFSQSQPDLNLYDEAVLSMDAKAALEVATDAEKAALDYDERVTNSDGASWSRNVGAVGFANSAGFAGGYRGSYVSFSVMPICDDTDNKKRNGYWWSGSRFLNDLEEPAAIGVLAAQRTLATLGSRKIDTCQVPVIFDRDSSRSIIGTVAGLANGSSFYRKSSYLVEREGTLVASPLVTIVDDPLIPCAPGSKPFDGEGQAVRKNVLVKEGVLNEVLCDTYTARKLGRTSTGSAGRGVGGGPGPTTTNLVLTEGEYSRDDIIAATERGLLVMSMMGYGFNAVTGDFSRGASGFWIEDGKIQFPVSEITISSNFDDMLKGIDMIGNDADRRTSTVAPTLRIANMMISGT